MSHADIMLLMINVTSITAQNPLLETDRMQELNKITFALPLLSLDFVENSIYCIEDDMMVVIIIIIIIKINSRHTNIKKAVSSI